MTIKKYLTVNYFPSRKGYIPDIIVLHNTGGNNISSAHYWFLDSTSQTSAHFLVGQDGEVRQYVELHDGSFCNGTSINKTANSYYKNSPHPIINSRAYNANYYTYSIECVGHVDKALTEAQIKVVAELVRYISKAHAKLYGVPLKIDRQHIIGHYEINPKTRSTCGRNIQFDKIIEYVNREPEVNASDDVKKTLQKRPIPTFLKNLRNTLRRIK